MQQVVHYEHPMHETIRVCLRLECLFAQIDERLAGSGYWSHRASVATIVDVINVLDRPDFKAKLTKHLLQCKENLSQHLDEEKVDQIKLQEILQQLTEAINYLQQTSGKLNQTLEQDEFLNSIRLRLSKTGGARNFDLPRYHYWLNLSESQRQRDIQVWLDKLTDIRNILELFLMLVRHSTGPKTEVAENGYYEKALDSSVDYQLVQVSVAAGDNVFPDISVGRHRMSLHFFSLDENGKPHQLKQDVEFKLALCQ